MRQTILQSEQIRRQSEMISVRGLRIPPQPLQGDLRAERHRSRYSFTCRTEMTPGTEASPLSVSSVIG
jgi:hypothetical protein